MLKQNATDAPEAGRLENIAISVTGWSERWFPDAYVFALLALVLVVIAALSNGTSITNLAQGFGDGFWGLIPFTMQMVIIIIGGYTVARSPVASRFIDLIIKVPKSSKGAIVFVAIVAISTSLINWAFSLTFCALMVRAMAGRADLRFDYRAASAAAYLGTGATWALGISSSAAQIEANPLSMPPGLLAISGVIPFSQTVFLWQSGAMLLLLTATSLAICYFSAPHADRVKTAAAMGVDPRSDKLILEPRSRPGEWLEYSPLPTLFICTLGFIWMANEFWAKGFLRAIADLNSYNLIFLLFGMLLNWRPKRFLLVFDKAVPATAGVLIQFPIYSVIAFLLSKVKDSAGLTLTDHLTHAFVNIATRDTFAPLVGIYSAVLGFFLPSGGGKWLVEAPYVMQTSVDLKAHLGWTVQAYNAAEALPNLINPFWMLPLLGILEIKARDIVGFTFLQFLVHFPLVIFALWIFGKTFEYVPPMRP